MKTKHDWRAVDALTEDRIHAAALADPDAQPLTEERLAKMRRVPRTKSIRRALGLSQEEFAARFHTGGAPCAIGNRAGFEPDAVSARLPHRDCPRTGGGAPGTGAACRGGVGRRKQPASGGEGWLTPHPATKLATLSRKGRGLRARCELLPHHRGPGG